MDKEPKKEYWLNCSLDNSYQGILRRIRFMSKEDIANEIASHLEAQYFLEQRINELIVRRSELHEHIENLKKASQDYCMCGELISKHGVNGDHAPISEFCWYIKENEL